MCSSDLAEAAQTSKLVTQLALCYPEIGFSLTNGGRRVLQVPPVAGVKDRLYQLYGERDDLGGGPQKVGVAVADLFTGMYATVAILAALRHAERTGQGQHIDMALLDTQVAMLANLGANYLVAGQYEGKVPGRMGNAHQNVVPYQVFETAPNEIGRAHV